MSGTDNLTTESTQYQCPYEIIPYVYFPTLKTLPQPGLISPTAIDVSNYFANPLFLVRISLDTCCYPFRYTCRFSLLKWLDANYTGHGAIFCEIFFKFESDRMPSSGGVSRGLRSCERIVRTPYLAPGSRVGVIRA